MLTLDEKLDNSEFRRMYGILWGLTHDYHQQFIDSITFKQFNKFRKHGLNLAGLNESQVDAVTSSKKLKKLWIKCQIAMNQINQMEEN